MAYGMNYIPHAVQHIVLHLGKIFMYLGNPTLNIENLLGSNPLKSRFLACALTVIYTVAYCHLHCYRYQHLHFLLLAPPLTLLILLMRTVTNADADAVILH